MKSKTQNQYDFIRIDGGKGYAIIRLSDRETIEEAYFRTCKAALKAAKLRAEQLNRQPVAAA